MSSPLSPFARIRGPVLGRVLLALCLLVPAATHAQDGGDSGVTSPTYVVGVEDRLHVFVWGEAELSLVVTVRPDGMITLPLVNEIEAAGRTPNAIRKEIEKRLADYVRAPNVSVIVDEIRSFKVYVLGEVNAQQAIELAKPVSLLQALALAGGLSEFSKKEATVIRRTPEGETRITIDMKKLLAGETVGNNIVLAPGDVLLVR